MPHPHTIVVISLFIVALTRLAPAQAKLQNKGKDCWNGCNSKQGPCSWCGTTGMCCKKGFSDKSNGCDGTFGGSTRHECVSAKLQNKGKDCWIACNSKQGPCSWCGTAGMCCKKRFSDKSNGCDGTFGGSTRHECVLSKGSGSASNSGLAKRQLDKHNYYRSMHGVRALKYSKSLENAAQKHANYLASLGEDTEDPHSKNRRNTGENIFQLKSTRPNPSAEDTTEAWYGEESNYDYRTGTSKNGKKIGHFTQLVWKGSTKFGIAKASGKRKQKDGWYSVWVVAQYSPAGNSVGQYIANVRKP